MSNVTDRVIIWNQPKYIWYVKIRYPDAEPDTHGQIWRVPRCKSPQYVNPRNIYHSLEASCVSWCGPDSTIYMRISCFIIVSK